MGDKGKPSCVLRHHIRKETHCLPLLSHSNGESAHVCCPREHDSLVAGPTGISSFVAHQEDVVFVISIISPIARARPGD